MIQDRKARIVVFKATNDSIEVPEGTNLLKAVIDHDIPLTSVCNAKGKCGKCKIKIHNPQISYTTIEKSLLTANEIEGGIHLACQVTVNNDLEIDIISQDDSDSMRKLMYGEQVEYEIDSVIQKFYVKLESPQLENQIDDLSNLIHSISDKPNALKIPLSVLQGLSPFLRKNDFKATLTVSGNEILNIESGDTTLRNFGLAFDLGTTTIVGTLIDLRTGKDIAVHAKTNPQYIHGADVISRLDYSINEPGGLNKLQKLVIDSINEIIEELCKEAEVNIREIYDISLAGNPIMNHIFLGVNPKYIGESPFIPTYRECATYTAEELNLTLLPKAQVNILPNISAYVGGDIVGFILAYGLHKREKNTLSIDIGTNGEIVFSSNDQIICCSAAAGPAFEGGHISCGMRATEGAIEKVVFDEDAIYFDVINETEPKGICGSGFIDLVAEMSKFKLIDQTGKICNADEVEYPWFKDRIIETKQGNSFVIVPAAQTVNNDSLLITQKDIRQFQLAKAAVCAGIRILLRELSFQDQDIEEILIAGAFGAYINKYNAQLLGLLPNIESDKINFVGNAASVGAKKFLLSSAARTETKEIIQKTQYIELSSNRTFQDEFAEAMFFKFCE